MPPPSPQEVIHSYRHFYRALLHAVQFAKPQRFIARDQLRHAYRTGHVSSFDSERISKTLIFLDHATQESGLEHKVLKNLLHSEWARQDAIKDDLRKKRAFAQLKHKRASQKHYEMTVAMLNSTMGLCLR